MQLTAMMTALRLGDGNCFLYSLLAAAIEALGRVAHLYARTND